MIHGHLQIASILISSLVVIANAQERSVLPRNPVRLSGRITYPNGAPLQHGMVSARRAKDAGRDLTIATDLDGHFTFDGLGAGQYELAVMVGGYQRTSKTIEINSGRNLDVGIIVLERCPVTNPSGKWSVPKMPTAESKTALSLAQIVIPNPLPFERDWKPSLHSDSPDNPLYHCSPGLFNASVNERAPWASACELYFERYVTLEQFLGGKIRAIRVVRVKDSDAGRPSGIVIQKRILSLWSRTFFTADCQMAWAEGAFWDIEALLEFEDGKTASLLTGGDHIQIQDKTGRYWFVRLPVPSKQK